MWPILILALFGLCQGSIPTGITEIRNNIILNRTANPAIYYMVYTPNTVPPSVLLQLDSSIDLIHWPNERINILDTTNGPLWTNNNIFQDPDIHVVNDRMVRIYYAAQEQATNKLSISVAFSETIDPSPRAYSTVNRPLVSSGGESDLTTPGLIFYDDGALLLTYIFAASDIAKAVILTEDGLTVQSTPFTVVEATEPWEKQIRNQWGFQKDGYIYVLYQSATEGVMGVARSVSPSGPYEKLSKPLLMREKSKLSREELKEALVWGEDKWPSL